MDTTSRLKNLTDTFRIILEEIPELTYVGDSVLRRKTAGVDLKEGIDIGNKLKATLKKYRDITGFGRGLAAPQIGEDKSVFITFVDDKFKIYINPKIIKKSDKFNLYLESCLSCGNLSADVKRPESITLKYISEDGQEKEERIDSLIARLIQHEYDHLEGIVNIDKAEPASIEFMVNNPLKQQLRNV